MEISQASQRNTVTNNKTNYNATKTKQKTKPTTIKDFFTASKFRAKHRNENLEDPEDSTNSLYYSSSTDSSIHPTVLRPSITIRQNSEIATSNLQHSNHNQMHEQKLRFTQMKLRSGESNLPFGDDIHEHTDDQTILFHNINGMKDPSNWLQILTTMRELNIDIFGFAELNQQMSHGKTKWTNPIRKIFQYSRNVHSESSVTTKSNYKPGGTMTIITGKWQSRVSEVGADPKGLGRWSYIKISSKKRNLIIITAYRPCTSQGINTTWMQQWSQLRESGDQNPDPIKAFYTHLDEQLSQWTAAKYEIILMIDANETVGEKPGGLTSVIGKAGLVDLVQHRHPHDDAVNTHARGSKQIDYIFATKGVSIVCNRAGILPFGVGYMSDHRALFIKVNMNELLSTRVQPIDAITARKLIQATPRERTIFLEAVNDHWSNQNLYERLQKLTAVPQQNWSDNDGEEFEKCDEQLIKGMISAETKTKKLPTIAWSPIFAKAVNLKSFWKIALQLKTMHRMPSDKFLTWAESIGIMDFKSLDITTVKQQLRLAQKSVREVELKAESLREEHLRQLLTEAEINGGESAVKRRLGILIRAQKQRQYFRRLKSIFKPQASGGLTYILVPENFDPTNYPYDPSDISSWESVHDQEAVQNFIQKRNITHFGQAHGSPFTIPPLNSIEWSANNIPAKELINGSIPVSFLEGNPQTEQVLRYIANRKKLPEIDTHITREQVSKGFRRWRETTSTSPSGCHLGLRRIATYPIPENDSLESIRQQILQAQTDIINIPLQNGISPKRWQTVVNAMLEKIPGKPLLHKLRVIHILEADYNLTLKIIFGKRLLQHCERYEVLGDLQDGFRKGRSTIRTLLLNELICDYNKRLRINNFVGMTDISGCFDRIVTPIISLLNIKNGCTPQAVSMHATTLQKSRYHLKTKLGVSEEFYSHSDKTPVYGNGQGAGDSPSQWCQQSAMLFDLYSKINTGTTISDRWGNTQANITMAAFADDTNLLGNDDRRQMTMEQLTSSAQKGFKTWSHLLNATGHFMELEKCSCYLSIWDFQEDGYAYTLSPDDHNQHIQVQDMDGATKEIPQLTSETSQKLLGVMRNPIGNQQDEVTRLRQKSDLLATQINLNALSAIEAKMAYDSFYIPAMRYSLAITSINQMDFESVQRQATSAILAAMGFNRHMPREVVFCSTLYQGLNLRHLYDIQGMESTRLILQELNSSTTTTKLLRSIIDVIQMEAGIGKPILEENRPLIYIEWGWIPSIRDFLYHIQASITNASSSPMVYREGDTYIMDTPLLRTMSRKEQILINRCRIFQQVECISDIATADGTAICHEWLVKKSSRRSSSNKVWPLQGDPGNEAWKIWRKFLIKAFTDGTEKLINKLAAWNYTAHRTHSAYYYRNQLWIQASDKQWTVHNLRHQGRRELFFNKQHTAKNGNRPWHGVPVDIKSEDSKEWIITGLYAERVSPQRMPTTSTPQAKLPTSTTLTNTRLQILVKEVDLQISLVQHSIIDIASDGSHDQYTGNLAYGWVIAINGTVTVKGQGRATCPRTMAGSFRSEVYGVAAAAQFASIMVHHFRLNPKEHKWYMYLDNKTLINKLERYRTETEHPKWNLAPDADMVKFAHENLRDIPLEFCHVKSHQTSSKPFDKLPIPVQMNIIADQLASEQMTNSTKPTETYVHYSYLKIKGAHITRNSKEQILEEASRIPIQQYYYEKYRWTSDTFHSVNWEVQRKVLMSYATNDQRRILKMVHGWLPTYERLHRENQTANTRCPLCHYRSETSLHIFCCSNPKQQETLGTIVTFLEENGRQGGNPTINHIIQKVLLTAAQTSTLTVELSGDPQIDRWIKDQNKIGWENILYGRTAQSLETAMETHFRSKENDTRQETGNKWVRTLIHKIWDVFLILWSQRNEIIHGKQADNRSQREHQFLEARVDRCYEFEHQLRAEDRAKIFFKTRDELLQEDARYVRAWIKLCERIIRVHKKETTGKSREGQFMENFFQWKQIPEPTRVKKKAHTPHQKQDLRPD
jgi:hypothetical protein